MSSIFGKIPVGVIMAAAVVVLVVLGLLNLFLGSVIIPPGDVWNILTGKAELVDHVKQLIVLQYRLPQAVTAIFAGAGLAVAGLLMQTLFRNPLADPSILGISSGSSLGVALLLLFSGTNTGLFLSETGWIGQTGLIMSALTGAFLVLIIISWLSRIMSDMVSLLIAGIMISYITGSLVGITKYFSQKEDLQAFVLWGLGSFSNVGQARLPFFVIAVALGLLLSVFLVKPLNLLLLGERYAANLGVSVKRVQFFILIISGVLTAVITAYTGPVAFIGLAVPHLARNLLGESSHRILLPAVMILGASLALACNLIARLPGFEGSLPVNAVTSLIGAPVVVWFLIRRKHLYSNGK